MKKMYCIILAIVMSVMMMGCSNKMSWARVEPVSNTGAFLFVSHEGDIRLYNEDGTTLYEKKDLREDGQFEVYDYGVAYINNTNDLILISAITGESKVCDKNVACLNGEAYRKTGEGFLLLAYKVSREGNIVSANCSLKSK